MLTTCVFGLHFLSAIATTYAWEMQPISTATRAAISRVSNIIVVLARYHVPLSDTILNEAYDWVIEQEVEVAEILSEEVAEAMVLYITSQV